MGSDVRWKAWILLVTLTLILGSFGGVEGGEEGEEEGEGDQRYITYSGKVF